MDKVVLSLIFAFFALINTCYGGQNALHDEVQCKDGSSLQDCLDAIASHNKVKILCEKCSNMRIVGGDFKSPGDLRQSLDFLLNLCLIENFSINHNHEANSIVIYVFNMASVGESVKNTAPSRQIRHQPDEQIPSGTILDSEDFDIEILPPATQGEKGITKRQLIQIESQINFQQHLSPDEIVLPPTSPDQKGITQRELEIILQNNQTLQPNDEVIPAANPGEKGLTATELEDRVNRVKDLAPPDEVLPPTNGKSGLTLKEIEAARERAKAQPQ